MSKKISPSDYKPLRDGEIKILRALQKEPLTFTSLKEITGLQQNVLSQYLKRLQKINVISKDIDSRRYQRREVSIEILFMNDVAAFLNEKVKEFTNLGEDKAQVAHLSLWTAFTEYPEMRDYMESLNMKPNFSLKLSQISEVIEDFWEPHILKTKYSPEDQQLIKTYKRLLLQYVKTFYLDEPTEMKRNIYEMLREMARFELEKRFPNCEISDRMVLIETAREYRKHIKLLNDTVSVFFQPSNLEEIPEILERLKNAGKYRDDLTEDEKNDLKKILDFLEKPDNKKKNDAFNRNLRNAQRKLILFYVSGFHGYIDQINKIKEMIEKTQKGKKLRHNATN